MHAEQPDDAAVARPGGHGVGGVARLECADADLPESHRVGDVHRHAGAGRHGAVAVHADHLDDPVRARPDHGVHAPISLDGVDGEGAIETKGASLGRRPVYLQGAVVVHAEQLDTAIVVRSSDHERVVADSKGVDLKGAEETAGRRLACLQRAVVVHAEHLDGGGDAVAGRYEVRSVAQGKGVDASNAADSQAVVAPVHRVRGDQRRDGVVDQDVARAGQRLGRAARRQVKDGGGSGGHVRDPAAGRQGAPAGIAQVVGALGVPHRVVEQELGGAATREVHCRAARVEAQLGHPLDEHGAVKGDRYVDCRARAVRAKCWSRGDVQHARGIARLLRMRCRQVVPYRRRPVALPRREGNSRY